MANEKVGAIFVPKSDAELRDQVLRDLRLAAIDTGVDEPPTQPGSDWYLLATALANLELIGLSNIAIADEDRSVLTATGDALDDIREAEGLPVVEPSGSSGRIRPTIFGTTTIVGGTVFVLPNGLRGRTVGTVVNPVDGDEIAAEAVDTGANTNLAGGAIVRFVTNPSNVAIDARVSFGKPLTGGTDEESDDRKRARILNVRRNKPAGGNWAHVRQRVLDNVGSIQDCYVYPALGGPDSAKVVPVKDFDPDNNDFSRACTTSQLDSAREFIHADMPTPQEIVVQAAADQNCDAAIHVTIPVSVQSGGNGRGWTDPNVWPTGVSTRVLVTNYVDGTPRLDVDAATATSPVAGQTHVAWWSPDDRKFYTALVTAVGGSAGAWELTLDRPLVSKDGSVPATGDFVSPSAQNLEKYGKAWVELFRKLGPGENTSDPFRLPRAKRHPFVDDEDPSDLVVPALLDLVKSNPEITNIEFGYVSDATANVPGSVNTAPNILVPRHFGVYEQ